MSTYFPEKKWGFYAVVAVVVIVVGFLSAISFIDNPIRGAIIGYFNSDKKPMSDQNKPENKSYAAFFSGEKELLYKVKDCPTRDCRDRYKDRLIQIFKIEFEKDHENSWHATGVKIREKNDGHIQKFSPQSIYIKIELDPSESDPKPTFVVRRKYDDRNIEVYDECSFSKIDYKSKELCLKFAYNPQHYESDQLVEGEIVIRDAAEN
jgi:hypothetical protein